MSGATWRIRYFFLKKIQIQQLRRKLNGLCFFFARALCGGCIVECNVVHYHARFPVRRSVKRLSTRELCYVVCVCVRERDGGMVGCKNKIEIWNSLSVRRTNSCGLLAAQCIIYLFITIPHAFACDVWMNGRFMVYAVDQSVSAIVCVCALSLINDVVARVSGNGVPITANCIESTINY